MKKKLSLLMVLMMMISLVPANMAFAGSKSDVTTSVTSSDSTVDFGVSIESTVLGLTSGGVFEMRLADDAEWVAGTIVIQGAPAINVTNVYGGTQRAEFKLSGNIAASPTKFSITGEVKLDGAKDGDQKVTIENVTNSGISREVLTYAVVSGSGTIMSRRLTDVKTLVRGTQDAAQFEIRETDKAAFDKNGVLELRLPRDMSWVAGTKVALASGTKTLAAGNTLVANGIEVVDGKVLKVNINTTDRTINIDRIVVEPKIDISKDARKGDVDVEIKGVYTADSVKIAEYKEYGINVKVDKVKEIMAGKQETNKDYVVKVTLEPAGSSLNINRPIDFEVLNGEVNMKTEKGTKVGSLTNITGSDYDSEFEATALAADKDMEFEFYVKADWDGTKPVELKISGGGVEEQTVKLAEVSAVAKLTSKIDTKEVADVVIGLQDQAAPVITLQETKTGSISEGWYTFDFSGSRYDGARFVDAGLKATVKSGNISVDKVKLMNENKTLVMKIDGESSKDASTIEITGLKVNLDRTVPYGKIELRFAAVGTPAMKAGVVVNNKYDDTILDAGVNERDIDFVDNEVKKIVAIPYLNVVTEVQTAKTQKTVFTLDSATYTVGADTKTLDAAPYISNNRTMLPIGTVAQLAGATLNYSSSTRTAIFTKDNLVVSMNLDTNMLLVNGSPVPMDAKPEIVNGRAFVPVVYVAQAFGIQNGTDIVYDAATKTVTLFPNAQ